MARHVHIHLAPTRDAWEEGKHPRKDDGKFGSGGGKGTAPQEMTAREHARREDVHRSNWNKMKEEDGRHKPGSPEAKAHQKRKDAEHAEMSYHAQQAARKPSNLKDEGGSGSKPAAQSIFNAHENLTSSEHAKRAAVHRSNWNKLKAQRTRWREGSEEAKAHERKIAAEHKAMVHHTQRSASKSGGPN